MTEFHVRPALFSDVDAITELAVEMVVTSRSHLRPEVTDPELREIRKQNFEYLAEVLRRPEGGLFVAIEAGGQLIGHVVLLANQTDSISELRQAWVYDLSVRRDWWGRGVARALMERAERFVAELGIEWVGLGVTAANARAVKLYEKLGYEIERVQMAKRIAPSRWGSAPVGEGHRSEEPDGVLKQEGRGDGLGLTSEPG